MTDIHQYQASLAPGSLTTVAAAQPSPECRELWSSVPPLVMATERMHELKDHKWLCQPIPNSIHINVPNH